MYSNRLSICSIGGGNGGGGGHQGHVPPLKSSYPSAVLVHIYTSDHI